MKKIKIGTATLIHGDCEEFMRDLPDKSFDLAVVDPPYGIGWDGDNLMEYNSTPCSDWKTRKPKGYKQKEWDESRPNKDYFIQINRVCDNQVIWGGNYFADFLRPTGGWIVWDKGVVMPTFSDGELAWCSINNSVKFIRLLWAGYRKCEETSRIHPTQKPVKLYEWILANYAKQGQTILDTHGGSMSSVIAALNMGFEITCIEKDEDYFNAAVERIIKSQQQQKLF